MRPPPANANSRYTVESGDYMEALVIVYTAQFTGIVMLLALNFFADKMPYNERISALERPCAKIYASWISRKAIIFEDFLQVLSKSCQNVHGW